MAESSPLAHSPTLVQGSGPETSRPNQREDSDEDLAAGAQVGEYVVERFLGAGAMGEVYAGSHPVIGKKVAIKVLKRALASTAEGAERFKREARAVNQVAHPNVIDVFSFGRTGDGRLYLVMELVDGKSLRKAVTAGPLPVATAIDVLAQIADALDSAHAKGVVHRDLKPDNVMLTDGDEPKVFVLDFGLAKLLSQDGADPKASMLTGQGVWLGTPGYMAPEQWSADGAGPASDRYSLGVMAFELLSGSLPFAASSLPQMMEQHFRAKVPALSTKGAVSLPSAFDPIVARAMAKDPDARFATAREMVDALRAAAGRKAKKPSAPAPRAWLPAVVGAGVLGVGLVAVISLRGSDEPTPRGQPAVQPPSDEGMIRIAIDSVPRGANVQRGNMTAATTTPTFLDVRDGEQLAFDLAKPGYATVHHEVVAHADTKIAPIALVAINGFEGVWMLPDGGLRAFRRDGEQVTASKLQSVDAEREFFRRYELQPALSGVTFSSTESIHEPGRPEHPSCYFPYTTEYHYEPVDDRLTVRREHVRSDVIDGKCVRKSSSMTEPEVLARADRASTSERDSLAPVGKPMKPVQQKKGGKNGLDAFAETGKAAKQRIADEKQRTEDARPKDAVANQDNEPQQLQKTAAPPDDGAQVPQKVQPQTPLKEPPAKNVTPVPQPQAPPRQNANQQVQPPPTGSVKK